MHRFHKGKGYCSCCYATEFVQVACGGCHGMARVHRRDTSSPRCGQCRRSVRACVRCGKPVPRAGIRIGTEAVACPSCAPNFRESEACSCCGRLTSRLTWGGEGNLVSRICEPCRNRPTHSTCAHCRRYRAVAGLMESGSPHCIDCGPSGVVWHECPGCGISIVGKGRGHCRSCLNHERLGREARLVAATLSGAWAIQLLEGFVSWLLRHDAASPKLPATLLSHTAFFVALDHAFDSSERLVAQAMLDLFSVQGLRRHLLPVRFLSETVGLEITDEEKAEHVETGRIAALIEAVEAQGCSEDFVRFNQWLILDGKPTRTRRLYLSTAARLSQSLGWIALSQLDQTMVDRYLSMNPGKKRPGRRTSVCPFRAGM